MRAGLRHGLDTAVSAAWFPYWRGVAFLVTLLCRWWSMKLHSPAFQELAAVEWSSMICGGLVCSLKTIAKLSKVQSSRDLNFSLLHENESAWINWNVVFQVWKTVEYRNGIYMKKDSNLILIYSGKNHTLGQNVW